MNTSKIATTLLDFESFLQSHKPEAKSFHPHFEQAVWEMVENGGKRFRPALIFCVVDAYAPTLMPNAFLPALSVEALHTFFLIHDDLPSIDDAPLRRNHATLHTKYDEPTAILSGDFLNSYAFYLISCAPLSPSTQIKLISTLASSAMETILGEALDCYFENTMLELEKVQTIHTLKTARLIASSLKIGGIISNLPDKELQKLWDFGILLGIFFQIRDDLIDATSTADEAGKPTQNDASKNSYVNLLGLEESKKTLQDYKAQLQQFLQSFASQTLQNNLSHLLSKYLNFQTKETC